MSRNAKKRKPRSVIDTNVLVAGISGFRDKFIAGKNPSADILHRWAEKNNFVWLLTEDILDEYKQVLKRLNVRSNQIGRLVNLIRERAEFVELRSASQISPDLKDDPFCLCANQGNANYLVTLNLKDFPQQHLNATVVSPAEFSQ